MAKAFLYYILATICFPSACFAQSQQDAQDVSERFFDLLCHSKTNVVISKSDSQKQKRAKAIKKIKDLAASYSEATKQMQIAVDRISLEGATTGEIRFFNSNGLPLLRQIFGCSQSSDPLNKNIDYDASDAASSKYKTYSADDEQTCYKETGMIQLKKDENGNCVPACDPGLLGYEGVLLPDGLHNANSVSPNSLFASLAGKTKYCVPCGAFGFQGNEEYSVTKAGIFECFDLNGCKENMERLDTKVTPATANTIDRLPLNGSTYPEVFLSSFFSNDDDNPRKAIYPKTVCITKCESYQERNPITRDCEAKPKELCEHISHRIQRLESLNFGYLLKIKNYSFCSGEEVYKQAITQKDYILEKLKNGLESCKDIDNVAQEAIGLTFSFAPAVHARTGYDCKLDENNIQNSYTPPPTSPEDAWAVEQSIDLDN